MMETKKPLLLKDFIELDSDSDSLRLPHAADTTVRFLLDAELRAATGSPSCYKNARGRLSAAIAAVRRFSSSPDRSSSGRGILSRSFSKKLTRSFWKRKPVEDAPVSWVRTVRDIVRLESFGDDVDARGSFGYPSPVVSTCSCSSGWSESDANASDFSEIDSGSPNSNPKPSSECAGGGGGGESSPVTATRHRKPKGARSEETKDSECQSEEEKEQLSPVSVMDFPYQDDDEEDDDDQEEQHDATVLCYHQRPTDIEQTKHDQLLQKSRRFECLMTELDPVDLDEHFASVKDHNTSNLVDKHGNEVPEEEQRARDLLESLNSSFSELPGWYDENVLLDFFIQGFSSFDKNGTSNHYSKHKLLWNGASTGNVKQGPQLLLKEASDWISGSYMRKEDHNGEMLLKAMEKKGCWRCLDEEGEELVVDMEGAVLEALLDELVVDLKSSS